MVPKKIGIDATPLREQLTGVGNYLYYLLKELVEKRPTYHFFLYTIRSSTHLDFFRKYPNVTVQICPFLGISEALWSQTTLAWLMWKSKIDLFWGVTQSVPLLCRTKSVITIYDFVYKLYPQSTSYVRGTYLRLFSKFLYTKATVITTISKGTAERLKDLYKLKTDAVIIPPIKEVAFKPSQLLTQYGLKSKDYFLVIGTLEPRKNIAALLQAYPADAPPLVIAGGKGWKDHQILQALKAATPNIMALGYVSDLDLTILVKEAKALLMPSLYEGYGMPLAEARSLGTPVICSPVPEMLEAAEGDAILLDLDHLGEILRKAILPPTKPSYPTNSQLTELLLEQFERTLACKKQ